MKNTYFTLITLVYNTKKEFLCECLESIEKIDYDNYEVIIVDDGSNQETKDILENYKDRLHANIIHQDNKGVSGSRLVGIAASKGEYIVYVDSDDIADVECLKELDKIIKEYHPDIINTNNIRFRTSIKEIIFADHFLNEGIVSKDDALRELCKIHIQSVTHKIVRKPLYDGMAECIDTSFINGEDFQQSAFLILKANKIYYTETPITYYRYNDEYREYYGNNIIHDVNYLIPGYKLIFLDKENDKYLSYFKTAATNFVIYSGFILCNMYSSYSQIKSKLEELNKQEIISILKNIKCSYSFVSVVLFNLLTKKMYMLFYIAAKIYKLTFGFDKSVFKH